MSKSASLDIVAINELTLDKECVRLPTDHLNASHHAAECRKDLQEAENDLKAFESQLARRIRDVPGSYGLEKVTESAIKEIVANDPKVAAKERAIADIRYKLDLAQALVSALETKKRSLTMLVDLYGMSYHAKVSPSAEGKAAMEERISRDVRTRTRMPNPRHRE